MYKEAFPVELRRYYYSFFGDEAEELMRTLREPVEKYYIRVNTLKISRDRLIENLRKEGLKPKRSPYLEEGIYFEREGPNFSDDYNPNLPKVVANKFASESVYQGAQLYAPGVLKADKGIGEGDQIQIRDPKGLLVGIGIKNFFNRFNFKAHGGEFLFKCLIHSKNLTPNFIQMIVNFKQVHNTTPKAKYKREI